MKLLEIIIGTIVLILMRHRIVMALMILLFPSSWTLEAFRKALKEDSPK